MYFEFLSEKGRPLVSKQKNQYKPQDSISLDKDTFIDALRQAVPNACLLKGILAIYQLHEN
jgi:hypothetical protein